MQHMHGYVLVMNATIVAVGDIYVVGNALRLYIQNKILLSLKKSK